MPERLAQLLAEMTPQEQAEVETFAAFTIVRRKLQKSQFVSDDISSQEMMQLVAEAGGFDGLHADDEDVYSIADGDEVQWPSESRSEVA